MSRRSIWLALVAAGCGNVEIGEVPALTPANTTPELAAMIDPGLPRSILPAPTLPAVEDASLWAGGPGSLLGDNRAMQRGDILTVVIEIDDGAQITNSSELARSGDQGLEIGALFGLPERSAEGGVSLGPAIDLASSGSFEGEGSIRRNERLELRVAATVVETLPNGVMEIYGSQEVQVNYELRELHVSGYVRAADISRQNEITYDRIASARISYGGRGQISAVQQPRYGQQIIDAIVPF